jgi:RHS repeat-associated protein
VSFNIPRTWPAPNKIRYDVTTVSLDQDEKPIAQTCTWFNNLHLPIQETRYLLNDQGEFVESLRTVLTYKVDKENRARSTSYNLPVSAESFCNTSSQDNPKWKAMKRSDAQYNAYDNPVETTEWLCQADGGYTKQSSVRTEYVTTVAKVQLSAKSWVSDELSRFVQYKEHRPTEDGRSVASAIICFQASLDAGVKLQPWKETSFQYDVVGRLVSTTLAWSSGTTIPDGTLSSVTTKTEYSELQDGILSRTEIEANGNRTVLQQDMRQLNGPVIRKTLPRGQSETLRYDGIGRLVQHTNALGQSTTTTYVTGPAATTKTVTSPQRYITKFVYDVLDREVVVYDNGDTTLPFTDQPTRILSRKSYDTLGRVHESADQFGLTRKFKYDTLSRPVAETDPHGNILGFRYDNGGLIVTQTVNGERRKITELDALSRPVRQTEYPDTGVVQYFNQASTTSKGLTSSNKRARDYDGIETSKRQKTLNGEAVSSTTNNQNLSPDQSGATCLVHETTYNGAGKIIQKSSLQKAIGTEASTPLETEKTTYGPDQTVLSQTITGYTAHGSDTIHRQYISDLFSNHVTYTKKTTYSDGRTFTHQGPTRNYSKNNQLESYWHQEGGTERYFYDANNWLQKTVRFDGTQVVYTSDDLGQTIKVVYSSGTEIENTFNADGKLIQVREGADVMRYSLSLDGTLTGVTYSDGRTQGATLDKFSRAVKEIDAFGVEKETEFNAVGQIVRVRCQGDTVVHSYGTANHTRGQYLGSTFSGTDEHRTNVSYDGFGRPSHNIVQDASSKTLLDTLYRYDANGKVQSLRSSSAVSSELNNERQFSYDGIGQVIREIQTSAETITSATKYAYDGNSNILSSTTDGEVTSMTYNRIDQRTDDGFKYDANGRLLQDNEGRKYSFDERDRLLSISSSSNTPTTFGYRSDDFLAQRYEGDTESATFYHKGGKINAIHTTRSEGMAADSKTSMFSDSGSIVSGSTNGHSIGRLLRQLGSTALIMDSGSHSSATYKAYGTKKTTASSSNILSHFGFTQAFTDEKTGLIYLNSRFYNPAQMAFLSMDSYQTENRYAYCEGDPINRIDPTGHSWVDWLATGAGIAVALGITAGISALTAGTAFPLAMAVLGGALAGAAGNLTSLGITHFGGSRNVSWEEAAWSVGTGALLGGVSAGLSGYAKVAAGGNFTKAVGYGAAVGAFGGAAKESAVMIVRGEKFKWGRVASATVQGAATGAATGYWGRRTFLRAGGEQNVMNLSRNSSFAEADSPYLEPYVFDNTGYLNNQTL